MKKLLIAVLGTVALAAVLLVFSRGGDRPPAEGRDALVETPVAGEARDGRIADVEPAVVPAATEDDASAAETEDESVPMTAEELAAEEDEKRVDAFDALTDKWMEPVSKGVSLADADAFVKQFSAVPKARREECLHRALNLIPDENVMLLAGILMDKSQDKELVTLVFNDVLNRDESVKKPIMQQIFKDKSHPCWADTAWILDVTGELPTRK